MRVTVLTLFPEMFTGILESSILRRARERDRLQVEMVQIRDFAPGPHRQVDDTPYGGGPGMVMKADVLERALDSVLSPPVASGELPDESKPLPGAAACRRQVVYLCPQGARFDQAAAGQLARLNHLILICGHYEGIDQRFVDTRVDATLSVGDYVLTGGEIPAMLVLDATARMIPGVLGHADSADQDSFQQGLLDHPHYTRPPEWNGKAVPPVLRSGHHGETAQWRRRQALLRTLIRRPDLIGMATMSRQEHRLITALAQELEATDFAAPPEQTGPPE